MTQTEFEFDPPPEATGQPPYPRPGFSLWDSGEDLMDGAETADFVDVDCTDGYRSDG